MPDTPIAALDITGQAKKTIYPPALAGIIAGRNKRRLGDHFGLTHFGVNLTQLLPGAASALLHSHSMEDEFIYIVSGTPVLIIDETEFPMQAGECCGFKAGTGRAHQLVNRSGDTVTYLEMGNRHPSDQVCYPNDDLLLTIKPEGEYLVAHKDGTPY